MSNDTLRIVIALVLIVHGIGHSLGWFPAFGWAKAEHWSEQSWLLSNILGPSATRWIGITIWLVALVGFLAAGLGLFGILVPATWWRTLAVVSAIVSLVGLALFWNAFPGLLNKVGAIGVDVAALVALLWARWPPAEMVGA